MKDFKTCKDISIEEIAPFLSWIKKIPQNYPEIQQIILFGSFARGNATEVSDIDLAISLTHLDQWSIIADKIRENKFTLKKLEVICLEKTSETFKKKILKEGIILYERSKNEPEFQ